MKRYLIGTSCIALAAVAAPGQAQDRYLGQVYMTGANYCPRGTLSAEGQTLSIQANTALFSLYGTYYGGNGTTTFGLPDYRGRSAIGQGSGPGLTPMAQGQSSGAETTTLALTNLLSHSHGARLRAASAAPNTNDPAGNTFPTFPVGTNMYTTANADVIMGYDEVQLAPAGTVSPQAFAIRDPYLAMRFCVVSSGIYPSRN